MNYRKNVQLMDNGAALAECGPMRLVISSWLGQDPRPDASLEAAEDSFRFLEQVAALRAVLSRPISQGSVSIQRGVGAQMIRSVLAVGEGDLTPMAAVAGSIADAVADSLVDRGLTKVVVNNGGDVAVRLGAETSATVGLRPVVTREDVPFSLTLNSDHPSWGIATSGLGGRSFTKGVASAATVIAQTASLADAAATAVANASFVPHRQIIQRPAVELDRSTDISRTPVTVQVGPLPPKTVSRALRQAGTRARELVKSGVILGAFVEVQGEVVMTDFLSEMMVA
jgi:hypothetical protein